MKNPALHQAARYAPATIIPLKNDGSLLEWLEANNRIIYREDKTIDIPLEKEEEFELIEEEVSLFTSEEEEEEEED